jgi:hydroxypyruvate isomerase
MKRITRREAVGTAVAGTLLAEIHAKAQETSALKLKGNVQQSACKWCYPKMSVEELARESAKLGVVGMDLIGPDDWPAPMKYGIRPVMSNGPTTITEGMNRRETHAALEPAFRKIIDQAAAAKIPSVICFSGNRRGMSDEEGWENCRLLLDKVKAQAEDRGVNLVMELLNSKVDHKDYMCDHTPWGVELVKRVNSPRFKLLYDIYHMQIMEGDVIRTIRDNAAYLAHFHTGGVPGRHEIDASQELNYATVARAILDTGFKGYFAHEFIPQREPVASLREAVMLCDV